MIMWKSHPIRIFYVFGLFALLFFGIGINPTEASRCKSPGPTNIIFLAKEGKYIDGFRIDEVRSNFGGCIYKQNISGVETEFWNLIQEDLSSYSGLDPKYIEYDFDQVVKSGIFKIKIPYNCGLESSPGNIYHCLPVAPIEKISESMDEQDLILLRSNYEIESQQFINKTRRQQRLVFLIVLGVTVIVAFWPRFLFRFWSYSRKWSKIITLLAMPIQFFLLLSLSSNIVGTGIPTAALSGSSMISFGLLIAVMILEFFYLLKKRKPE